MRPLPTLPLLCALLTLSASTLGCRDQHAAEEQPPLEDTSPTDTSAATDTNTATTADTATSTATDAPTSPEDTPEDTQDTPEDTSEDVQDADTTPTDPCTPPGRISPQTAHGSGGAVVTLEGAEFYIGALWWCLALDDANGQRHVVSGELYALENPNGQCNISFMLPPLPPGTYQARASYGCQFDDGDPRTGSFGALTITSPAAPSPVATRCDDARPCALSYERCHPSLGLCVGDICQGMSCYDQGTPPPSSCALVTGCLPPALQCVADDDCRVESIGCGCLGVHADDARAYSGECYLGGCVDCDAEPCGDRYAPWCDAGRCALRPR